MRELLDYADWLSILSNAFDLSSRRLMIFTDNKKETDVQVAEPDRIHAVGDGLLLTLAPQKQGVVLGDGNLANLGELDQI